MCWPVLSSTDRHNSRSHSTQQADTVGAPGGRQERSELSGVLMAITQFFAGEMEGT